MRVISRIAQDISGISINENKSDLVYSRLRRRLRENNISNFEAYCELVQSDGKERMQMIAALTTNVTAFYREPHHFRYLAHLVNYEFLKRIQCGEELRIWSAACSSGEEAYSAALTVSEALSGLTEFSVKILGTDIDQDIILKAQRGIYDNEGKNSIPSEIFNKFCVRQNENFGFRKEISEILRFKQLNLIGEWPFNSRFHAIFCRNVSIYFDKPTREKLWRRLSERLHQGGELYIGHSERVAQPEKLGLRPIGLNAYKKVM